MTSQPLIHLIAYDIWDDDDCACETCATPWGTDIPTSALGPGS